MAAVALGAKVLERHITLDKTLKGSDHKASLERAELTELVRAVRLVERALGTGIKQLLPCEHPCRDKVRCSKTLTFTVLLFIFCYCCCFLLGFFSNFEL